MFGQSKSLWNAIREDAKGVAERKEEFKARREEFRRKWDEKEEEFRARQAAFDRDRLDAEAVIRGSNKIIRRLGGKVDFENFDEFDALMRSDKDFVL
jgi:predicted  nucleic acid-binding Zn-ribbon protein